MGGNNIGGSNPDNAFLYKEIIITFYYYILYNFVLLN